MSSLRFGFAAPQSTRALYLLIISLTRMDIVGSFDLEIVSIVPLKPLITSSLPWTGPAYHHAVESVNAKYRHSIPQMNVTLKIFYNTTDTTCEESDYSALLSLINYYYESRRKGRTCFAIVAGACGGILYAPYLAREWDVLLMSKRQLHSEWAFRMKDTREAPSIFYELLPVALMSLCRKEYTRFFLETYTFDTNEQKPFDDVLRLAKSRSRVTVVIALTKVLIDMMETLRSFDVAPNDHVATAYQNVIYISTKLNDRPLTQLNEKLIRESREKYGLVYENGSQPLDLFSVRGAYSSVELFAQLVQESLTKGQAQTLSNYTGGANEDLICGGRRLAQLARNRLIRLTAQDVYVDKGTQESDLEVYMFSTSTMKMKLVATYSQTALDHWQASSPWTYPNNISAPPDIPACGFSGVERPCGSRTQGVAGLPVGIALLLMASASSVILLFVLKMKRDHKVQTWWIIRATNISPTETYQYLSHKLL